MVSARNVVNHSIDQNRIEQMRSTFHNPWGVLWGKSQYNICPTCNAQLYRPCETTNGITLHITHKERHLGMLIGVEDKLVAETLADKETYE
jgi:hypothetical protein